MIVEISNTGNAQIHLVGIDIFTRSKLEASCPPTHNMDVPNVTREEYKLLNIEGGFLQLVDENDQHKDDVRVPDGDEIMHLFCAGKDITVGIISAMGEEACVAFMETPYSV